MSQAPTFKLIDASAAPDGDLCKEVYAHFGLCMFLAQVFETGLINILTALETAASENPIRRTFDELYAKHETLTFGNLMKALQRHNIVPSDLEQQILQLKAERDRLAHRFFREHDLNFATIAGCSVMIEQLTALREQFTEVDQRLSALQEPAFARIGLDPGKFRKATSEILVEMRREARSRYITDLDID